jgi:hypothetical protein
MTFDLTEAGEISESLGTALHDRPMREQMSVIDDRRL